MQEKKLRETEQFITVFDKTAAAAIRDCDRALFILDPA
jgi:hypothetical protein